MSTTIDNPNLYTPIPPDIARRLAIHQYVAAGSFAVLLWDILLHIPQDYTIMRGKRPNISSVVYVVARLSTLTYVLGRVIIETAPIGNCSHVRRVNFLYPVALPFTTLLLVFRTVACSKNNKYVAAFFTLTWLAFLASCIVVSTDAVGMQTGNTPYCLTISSDPRDVTISVVSLAIHDTLIFVATTWVFMKNSHMEINLKNAFNVMVLGRHLLAFSKALMRDGQFYFLATMIFNVWVVLFFVTTQKSFVAPCTFSLPNVVLTNTMSCHLYRNVRRELYRDHSVNTENIRRALEESPSPNQHHQMGIAFPRRGPRHGRHLSQDIDPEAARN